MLVIQRRMLFQQFHTGERRAFQRSDSIGWKQSVLVCFRQFRLIFVTPSPGGRPVSPRWLCYYACSLMLYFVIYIIFCWNAYFASHSKHNLTYNMAAYTWWPWIKILVTSLHLICYSVRYLKIPSPTVALIIKTTGLQSSEVPKENVQIYVE